MSNFTASVTLKFIDSFSSSMARAAGKARAALGSVKRSVNAFKSENLLQTSANLSLVSGHVAGMARSVGAATNAMSGEASEFESSLAAVRSSLAMSVGAGKEMDRAYNELAKSAKAWSSGHAESASEYAQTSYLMLSAGLDTKSAIEGTNASLLLAKATMGSSAEAGNLLATAYNNMSRDGESAQGAMSRLSDVIAKTQGMFQIANLNQLGEGLKYAVAAAKPAGMQMEQVATIVGALNSAGLQGSQAGTAFAATLRNIDKAGKQLGFEVAYDKSGGLNLIATLENINRKFGDVETRTVEQRQALQRTFGDEGVRAINLLGGSLDTLKNSYKEIQNASGTTGIMAGEMADTYAQKMQVATNRVKNFQASLGVGANAVRLFGMEMLGGVAGFAGWVAQGSEAGNVLMNIAGGAMQVTGSLFSVGSSALSSLTGLASFMMIADKFPIVGMLGSKIGGLAKGVLGLGKSIIGLLPTLGTWIAGVWSAAVAHIIALAPIYKIIAVVALVGAGLALLAKHWDVVSSFMKKVVVGAFEGVKSAVNWVYTTFMKLLDNPFIVGASMLFAPFITIPALIIKHWEPIKAFFAKLLGGVGKVFSAVGKFFGATKGESITGNTNIAGIQSGAGTHIPIAGARAMGGPVKAGLIYEVGENGREFFTPNRDGYIVPNHAIGRGGTHGTAIQAGREKPTQNVNITIAKVALDAPKNIGHFMQLLAEFAREVGYANA